MPGAPPLKADLQPLVDHINAVVGHHKEEYWRNMRLFLSAKICRDEFGETLHRLFGHAPNELVAHNQLLVGLVYNVQMKTQYAVKAFNGAPPGSLPQLELLPGYRNSALMAQVAKLTTKDHKDKKQGKRPLQADRMLGRKCRVGDRWLFFHEQSSTAGAWRPVPASQYTEDVEDFMGLSFVYPAGERTTLDVDPVGHEAVERRLRAMTRQAGLGLSHDHCAAFLSQSLAVYLKTILNACVHMKDQTLTGVCMPDYVIRPGDLLLSLQNSPETLVENRDYARELALLMPTDHPLV